MTARERVGRTRLALGAIVAVRGALAAAAAALLAWAILSVASAWWLSRASPGAALGAALAAGIGTALLVIRRAGGVLPRVESVALWIEERVPGLQYALVTAMEGGTAAPALESSLRARDWSPAVRRAAARSLRLPVVTLVIAALVTFAARAVVPAVERAAAVHPRGGVAAPGGSGSLEITSRVTAPAYARLPIQSLRNPAVIRALEGSAVTIQARAQDSLRGIVNGEVLAGSDPAASRLTLRVGPRPVALRLEGRSGSRVVALESIPDSVPVVTLNLPARDTVLRAPRGTMPLGAELRDDLGLRRGHFEYIVSSGDGEAFTFRSGTLAARALGGPRQATLAAPLALEALELKPGDVVHLRAVAIDARDDSARGLGASETRTIRIARTGEYDSVAVEAAAPPEADKSILSQRMLINMTEALVRRRPTLAGEAFSEEARRIGRDQARLRRQVSEIVFTRLGDDPSGEHFRGDGHDHTGQELRPALTPDELLKAAEAATAAAAAAAVEAVQDETPIVAINRPLLEAYNAMWDAGRELEQIAPERALPHMYRALAAIQRARAAERLYLRSRPPRAVVDIDRVRLQGKDTGDPAARAPRESMAPRDRAAMARFMSAVALATADATAAGDSLLLLRIELLNRNTRAATALGEAAESLRAGHDATTALLRARRALETAGATADSLSRWGGAR